MKEAVNLRQRPAGRNHHTLRVCNIVLPYLPSIISHIQQNTLA